MVFYHDNDKFILLLQKGAYPYEYMDDWEKFNETSSETLSEKEDFYWHLNIEDISQFNLTPVPSLVFQEKLM